MEINKELIDHLAHLSRLEFSPEEQKTITEEFKKIVGFVSKIDELSLENVEPLKYMTNEVNKLREDISKTTLNQEQALRNAPKRDSDYFKVPKVVNNPKNT
jgi:aspartyl-tRNA(Asn)/glutamyl-tRNA(Gln) amidotransferase subunit C